MSSNQRKKVLNMQKNKMNSEIKYSLFRLFPKQKIKKNPYKKLLIK